jgi:hypothetical protein
MKKDILSLYLIAVALGLATSANAETQYLDLNGATAGFGEQTTGLLDWSAAVWTTDATGTSATSNWVNGNDAVLSASVNGAGSGGITGTTSATNIGNMDLSGFTGYIDFRTNMTVNGTINTNQATRQIGGELSGDITMSYSGTAMHTFHSRGLTSGSTINLGNATTVQTNMAMTASSLDGATLVFDGANWRNNSNDNFTNFTLQGNGSFSENNANADPLTMSATLQFGSAGATGIGSFTGDIGTGAITLSGDNQFDINRTSAVLTQDAFNLDVEGSIVLGGDLVVTLLSGSDVLELGDTFSLFSVTGDGTITGSFNSIDLSSALLTGGLTWDVSQLTGGGTGDLSVVPEPGTCALIGGMLALSFVMVRRNR